MQRKIFIYGLILGAALLLNTPVHAQSKEQVIAAYLEKIANYIKWNEEKVLEDNVFTIAVIGDLYMCDIIKDAYQKLSWHALLFGNEQQFLFYKKQCKQKGQTIVGSDKSALKEAEANERPNPTLLKSRLLFDGGYYQQAYDLLRQKDKNHFKHERFQLEYSYRMGRITHALQQYAKALQYYHDTIDEGRDATWYFACRAALEQGKIYETLQHTAAAKKAYQNCLSIKPDEHKTGLHHQAKAGLSRLE